MEVCCAECKECIQHATFRGESLLFYAFSLAEGFCFGFGFDFFFPDSFKIFASCKSAFLA